MLRIISLKYASLFCLTLTAALLSDFPAAAQGRPQAKPQKQRGLKPKGNLRNAHRKAKPAGEPERRAYFRFFGLEFSDPAERTVEATFRSFRGVAPEVYLSRRPLKAEVREGQWHLAEDINDPDIVRIVDLTNRGPQTVHRVSFPNLAGDQRYHLLALGRYDNGSSFAPLRGHFDRPSFRNLRTSRYGGTFLELRFTSLHKTVPTVVLSEKEISVAHKNGRWQPAGLTSTAHTFKPASKKTQHYHRVVAHNLKPDTKYFVSVFGMKSGRYTDSLYPLLNRSFKTQRRKVTVRFQKIDMIDDSDDTGAGEFWFWMQAYDGTGIGDGNRVAEWRYPKEGTVDLSSGTKGKALGFGGRSFFMDENKLTLAISAADDDDDPDVFFSELNREGKGPPNGRPTKSSSDLSDRAGDTKVIAIKDRTLTPNWTPSEHQRIPFSIAVDGGDEVCLKYTIYGTVEIDYAD